MNQQGGNRSTWRGRNRKRDKGDKAGSSPCASEQKAEKPRPRATSVTNHGPAPLPSPTEALRHFHHRPRLHATSATYRDPAPLPSLLYKASTTSRRKGTGYFHFPIHSSFFTTGRRRGQARRGGAPSKLHRAIETPPRHRNSTAPSKLHRAPTARRRRRPPQELRLAALPYLSQSHTLLPLLSDLVLNSCSFNSLCKLF